MRSHFDRAVPQNSAECGISHRGNFVHGAGAPLPPSEGFGFRAPPVADAARRQAAAVRKCESKYPKHERRTARGQGVTAYKGLKRRDGRRESPDQLMLWRLRQCNGGAENARRHFPCYLAIKMCAHGAHTFVFHAPEGRASYTVGMLHAPKARFACVAKLRLRRTVPRETVFSTEKRLWKNVFEKKTKKACIPE